MVVERKTRFVWDVGSIQTFLPAAYSVDVRVECLRGNKVSENSNQGAVKYLPYK